MPAYSATTSARLVGPDHEEIEWQRPFLGPARIGARLETDPPCHAGRGSLEMAGERTTPIPRYRSRVGWERASQRSDTRRRGVRCSSRRTSRGDRTQSRRLPSPTPALHPGETRLPADGSSNVRRSTSLPAALATSIVKGAGLIVTTMVLETQRLLARKSRCLECRFGPRSWYQHGTGIELYALYPWV